MKVAIVHDYLVNRGGAERVVEALHQTYPDAPIYTSLFHPEATHEGLRAADVRISKLQRFSKDPSQFRKLLPLFARAFRRMKVAGADVVISSSAGFAHAVRPKDGCHIVYCHTPPRFLWDPRYDRAAVATWWQRPAANAAIRWLRHADLRSAKSPHFYLANSKLTAQRVHALYGRHAEVIYPPIDVAKFAIAPTTGDYHLVVTRLTPQKRVDVAVRAFTQMGRRLIVVGDGPARASLEEVAGPTIEFHGAVTESELVRLYGRARGVVVPAEEEFGIVALEANASGRPVMAYGIGGSLETVVDGVTGVLWSPDSPIALRVAVERADHMAWDPIALRAHAEQFSLEAFSTQITEFVERATSACLACARHGRGRWLRSVRPAETEALHQAIAEEGSR